MANVQQLKADFHTLIDNFSDTRLLEEYYIALKLRQEPAQKTDILDFLSTEELDDLNESIKETDEGKTVPHEDVVKWLKQHRLK
jgi:hypothetical protein